jgi:hypothetical protein
VDERPAVYNDKRLSIKQGLLPFRLRSFRLRPPVTRDDHHDLSPMENPSPAAGAAAQRRKGMAMLTLSAWQRVSAAAAVVGLLWLAVAWALA